MGRRVSMYLKQTPRGLHVKPRNRVSDHSRSFYPLMFLLGTCTRARVLKVNQSGVLSTSRIFR